MSRYSLTQLSDALLLAELPRIAARDRATTAELLAHLAEAELRRLYAAAGYSSMLAYCVGHLRYSESAAERRVQAARIARAYPVLFDMLADGRMNLSSLLTLGQHLTPEHADELLAASTGKSRREIEWLLAERYPRPEMFEWGTSPTPADDERSGNSPSPARLDPSFSPGSGPIPVPSHAPGTTPLGNDRVALQVTVSRTMQQKLQHAKELLGFEVAGSDTAAVLERGLDALIESLEKKRYGRHTRHRANPAASPAATRAASQATSTSPRDPRHIPSALREEIAQRDGERCTFVSDSGHRCESRHALEFDHVVPLARGGVTRADNLRLLCPAHNQSEADRRLGRTFMNAKRRHEAPLVNHARDQFPDAEDVRAALVTLGFRKEQIAPAMEFAAGLPRATPAAERVRAILKLRAANRREAFVGAGPGGGGTGVR